MAWRRTLTQLWSAALLVALFSVPTRCGTLDHLLTLKPKAPVAKQAETVRGLLSRLLPKQAHLFEVVVDEHFTSGHLDKFKV